LVEQRAGTKGNADQQSTRRAQEREGVSQALGRIGGKEAIAAEAGGRRKAGYALVEDVRYNERSAAERVNGGPGKQYIAFVAGGDAGLRGVVLYQPSAMVAVFVQPMFLTKL